MRHCDEMGSYKNECGGQLLKRWAEGGNTFPELIEEQKIYLGITGAEGTEGCWRLSKDKADGGRK